MQKVIVKTYRGSQQRAFSLYESDVPFMAEKGYIPTSQVWAEGSWGCVAFLVALLLCFLIVGIFIFIYMLIVKPAGKLTVTYQLQPS